MQNTAGVEPGLSVTPLPAPGIQILPTAPCCMAVYLLPHCTELICSPWTSCPQQLHCRPGAGYHSGGIHIPEADILPANQIAPESMYIEEYVYLISSVPGWREMLMSAKGPFSPTAQMGPVWERVPEWAAAQGSRPLGRALSYCLSGSITLWKRNMHTCTQGLWALRSG